jgi:hypothetical protein
VLVTFLGKPLGKQLPNKGVMYCIKALGKAVRQFILSPRVFFNKYGLHGYKNSQIAEH